MGWNQESAVVRIGKLIGWIDRIGISFNYDRVLKVVAGARNRGVDRLRGIWSGVQARFGW
jgi:hypothetical protein